MGIGDIPAMMAASQSDAEAAADKPASGITAATGGNRTINIGGDDYTVKRSNSYELTLANKQSITMGDTVSVTNGHHHSGKMANSFSLTCGASESVFVGVTMSLSLAVTESVTIGAQFSQTLATSHSIEATIKNEDIGGIKKMRTPANKRLAIACEEINSEHKLKATINEIVSATKKEIVTNASQDYGKLLCKISDCKETMSKLDSKIDSLKADCDKWLLKASEMSVTASSKIIYKSDGTIMVQASSKATLKVGGKKVEVSSGAVSINGTALKIT